MNFFYLNWAQTCKHTNIQTYKHANMQTCKHANIRPPKQKSNKN